MMSKSSSLRLFAVASVFGATVMLSPSEYSAPLSGVSFAVAPVSAESHGDQGMKVGEHVTVMTPWARASAGMVKSGGVFMEIQNTGETDTLLSASSDVSEVVELHTHIRDGDIMRMRKVENIEIAGGTSTLLAPGGLHVMLIGLKSPLVEGESLALELQFENAGSVSLTVPIKAVGASMGHGDHGHHHGDHKH